MRRSREVEGQSRAKQVLTLERSRGRALLVRIGLTFTSAALVLGLSQTLALRHALVSAPLGIADPQHVYHVVTREAGSEQSVGRPYTTDELRSLPQLADVVRSAAGYSSIGATIEVNGDRRPANLLAVTPDYFATLGARLAQGQWLPEADNDDYAFVAAHSLFVSALQPRGLGIGDVVRIDGQPYTIAGVAQPGFSGARREDISGWVSYRSSLVPKTSSGPTITRARWALIVRLDDERGMPAALSRIESVLSDRQPHVMRGAGSTWSTRLHPVHNGQGNPARLSQLMRWLSVTCLALGVIALVNIIFLSFIDAVSQQSRIAISYALGARFRRLVAQPSARFALFAIIGMAVGLLIDLELRRHIASFLQLTPDQIAFSTPQKIAVVATLLGAAIGATVPWFITVRHAIRDVILLLRGQVASSPPRGRYGLLAVQAAVASSLLLIAVQYWVATRRLQAAQLQFAPKEMLVARIRTDDPERMTEAYAWRTRMVAQPEVVDVAFATMIPTEGSMTIPFRATDGNAATVLYANAVDERYFRVTRMRLIKGRGISAEDGATGRLVAVINETLDRQLSEAGMPFGTQCLGSSTTFCGIRVVGVVEDSKYLDLLEQPLPFAFTALAQRAPGVPIVAHVRVRPGTVPQVTSPLWRDILYTGTVFRSLSDVFRSRLAPWTTGVVLFSVVASLGLLIAVAGVSTLVWSLIRSRSRELAVRAAVGAGPAMLARTILSRLAGWIFPGVLSGLVAGSYLSRLLGDRAITPSPELAALVGVTLIATYFGAAALSAWSVATSPISMRHLSADS